MRRSLRLVLLAGLLAAPPEFFAAVTAQARAKIGELKWLELVQRACAANATLEPSA